MAEKPLEFNISLIQEVFHMVKKFIWNGQDFITNVKIQIECLDF